MKNRAKLVIVSFLGLLLLGVLSLALRDRSPVKSGKPPATSANWPCRAGKEKGIDYIECNPRFIRTNDAVPKYWVGNCPSLGIMGYHTGPRIAAKLHANGWYRLSAEHLSGECELTIAEAYSEEPQAWMQYGSARSKDSAGPYTWCAANGNCVAKFRSGSDRALSPGGNQ